MNLSDLIANARVIEIVVEGTSWQLDETVDAVAASDDLDMAGQLLVSAAEISARRLALKLLEREAYEPLAVAACLRRQPRRPGEGAGGGGGVARRVFRDIDAEEGEKGVPDYIRADIEEMAGVADQTRSAAMMRESAMDRDPIRQYIVDQLASRISQSEAAMDALVAIAHACAWEETRRSAALKVANDPISVARLARALRTDDITSIAKTAVITAVAEGMAREMGKHFKASTDAGDIPALRFMAQHHPDATYRERAEQWAQALEQQRGQDTEAQS